MARLKSKTKGRKERGMALLLALFALLLLSAIGLFMVLSTNTETHVDANYSNNMRSYYAAHSGIEEVRDRMKFPSTVPSPSPTPPPGGLADLLPQDIAGNANGVLYVLNPAPGETVNPADPTSPYFDDELCHDFNSGVAGKDSKCTVLPNVAGWNLPQQAGNAQPGQLGYKWVRINMKTNRIADPYCVDGSQSPCDPATQDTRVCWDGQTEQLSPDPTTPSCDANGMQTVYMLTSLAATPQVGGPGGSRRLVRSEVVAPSIRPAGMVTMGTMGAKSSTPVLGGNGIPGVAIDGRVHDLSRAIAPTTVTNSDGTVTTVPGACSAIAPLATNNAAGTAQLESALNLIRKSIVDTANASCNANGTSTDPNHLCTYGLWWVHGTDPAGPRFVTSGTGPGSPPSSTVASPMAEGSSSGSGPGGPGDGSDGSNSGKGHHHHHHPSGTPDSSGACDPADHSCYTNLNLSSPELFATAPPSTTPTLGSDPAPFTGGNGNQTDTTIYQPGFVNTINNEIQAVQNLVTASSGNSNYYTVSQASLAPSYGSAATPAIVVIQDQVFNLQGSTSLTGYGVLVIPGSMNIGSGGPLQWTGIVLIESPTGQLTVNPGATGFINGALLLQPGAALNLQATATTSSPSSSAAPPTFSLTYSCEAVDLPFKSTPFKVISSSEGSQ